jgi:hypothetical protein
MTTDNRKGVGEFNVAKCRFFGFCDFPTEKDVGWAGSVSPETPAISGFHGIAGASRFKIG